MNELLLGIAITVVGGVVVYFLQRAIERGTGAQSAARREIEYENSIEIQKAARRVAHLNGEIRHCLFHSCRIDPAHRERIDLGLAPLAGWKKEVADYAAQGLEHVAALRRVAREASAIVGEAYWLYVEGHTDRVADVLKSRHSVAPYLQRVDVPDVGTEVEDAYTHSVERLPLGLAERAFPRSG